MINWQSSTMYELADAIAIGIIKDNLVKQQLSYYRLVGNAAMIAKIETAKKVVKLRKLAVEIEAYNASL